MTLDRSEYFPGELAALTIAVENPTSETLEIPEPFVKRTGTIAFLQKGSRIARAYGQNYGPLSEGPLKIEEDPGPLPSVSMKPGAILTKKLHSYDHDLTDESYVFVGGAAPNWSGDFRLAYWGASADFRVVMPIFEGMIKIDTPQWEERQKRGAPEGTLERLQKFVYAFVLAADGKHYLCLDKEPYAGRVDTPPTDSNHRLLDRDFHLTRYSRVAESDTPIVSPRGEMDAAGNLHLTWGEAGERRVFVESGEFLSGTLVPR